MSFNISENTSGVGGDIGSGDMSFLSNRHILTYAGGAAAVVTAGGALAVAGMVMPVQLIGGVVASAGLVAGGLAMESGSESSEEEADAKPAVKAEVEVVTATA